MLGAQSSAARSPQPGAPSPEPWYACLYRPPQSSPEAESLRSRPRNGEARPASGGGAPREIENEDASTLVELAQDFSPRFETAGGDLILIDISGLDRLLGTPRAIGEEIRHSAAARGLRVHVAIAATRAAAMVLACARQGLTVVERGHEADQLVSIRIEILETIAHHLHALSACETSTSAVPVFRAWGLKTLGELAALPSADLAARLGQRGLVWQTLARGQDVRPLVPALPEERFEASIELDWPIEGLEPLSFVLTRLLEPLSTRLERRDRGAAALHVTLGLVKCHSTYPPHQPLPTYQTSLQLPAPMRDVRTLRTLILLHLESHPPPAAIEQVTVRIEPTPGRVLQHTLFTRAHPTPEQLSTLVARLAALMGQDRLGRPALVDSYRPGTFVMAPFAREHHSLLRVGPPPPLACDRRELRRGSPKAKAEVDPLVSALRRYRHPVPARVSVAGGKPVAITANRCGFASGRVLACAGPWRTSGEWWKQSSIEVRSADERRRPVLDTHEDCGPSASGVGVGPHASKEWDRDEWDVSLSNGAVCRIFQNRDTGRWFIDALAD